MDHFQHAVVMFGGQADLARAINADRASVSRWVNGTLGMHPHHQLRILQAGAERGMDLKELAWALDVERCRCCGEIVDDDIRDFVKKVATIKRSA